ncbi:MAG: type II toxin-antitoxin system RelE/ParE family toxin [Candidatus Hydrogenedentes bacterium]|nr:type II toxin-antitoxin system RelE/ParE family toxin [Candidatus Hydrogenedentota bacterium]
MMDVRLLEPAQQELEEAAGYYEALEDGLGISLATEFHQSLDRIREYPKSYPVISGNVRRCMVHRFKYQIVYDLVDDLIVVLAVVHERQDPKIWQDRI